MQGRGTSRARGFARLAVLAGVLCASGALLAFPRPAYAAPSGTLSMNPSNTSLNVGDTVSLTLDLAGTDIHEVHIGVTYNAGVVQVVDANASAAGVQILPGPFPGDDTMGTVLQNSVSSGIINYQYELNASDEMTGAGTVATVQFVALANGNANLAWTTRTIRDGSGVSATATGIAGIIVVGGTAPTNTPTATVTPAATNTAAATNTPVGSPTATRTATATRTVTPTRTATAAGNPPASEVEPTSTPRITIISNSNASPTPRTARFGVDPSQTDRANGLPDAGTEGPGIAWWRWSFFAGALMLAFAGWFFTFAVHYANKDVVLLDKWQAARRRGRSPRRRWW